MSLTAFTVYFPSLVVSCSYPSFLERVLPPTHLGQVYFVTMVRFMEEVLSCFYPSFLWRLFPRIQLGQVYVVTINIFIAEQLTWDK